jgi:hypothetical protein
MTAFLPIKALPQEMGYDLIRNIATGGDINLAD